MAAMIRAANRVSMPVITHKDQLKDALNQSIQDFFRARKV